MTPTAARRPRRKRETRRSARLGELCARSMITVGGIGTILAIGLICVFLLWVVVPLFLPARLGAVEARETPGRRAQERAVRMGVDEYGRLGWTLARDGTVRAFRLDTGEELARRRAFEEGELTAWSFLVDGSTCALGFADGSVRLGRIRFRTSFAGEEVDRAHAHLRPGELAAVGEGVGERTPEGQLRLQELDVALGDPLETGWSSAIRALDMAELPAGPVFAALGEDGGLALYGVRRTTNLLTGEETLRARRGSLPFRPGPDAPEPDFLLVSGGGDMVYLAWGDGRLLRFDARDLAAPVLCEEVDLVPEPGERLTSLIWLNGRSTLVAGDSLGRTAAWFRVRREGAETSDGMNLLRVHDLGRAEAAVTALATSSRSRLLASGHADGLVRLHHVTSAEEIARSRGPEPVAVEHLVVAPKQDALVALAGGALWRWELDARHPEASLASLFRPVWYEGASGPEHVWQSSSGTDEFEPKLGLMPLVFGTFKATLYSMLFGVPLAILAAIYSSELLHPRLRTGVKSTVEMMASLPSVVLGFLAALVIAPFVQRVLPGTLAAFLTVPASLLLGAYLWQLLPHNVVLRYAGWQRWMAIALMLPIGVLAARWAGPLLERLLFAGDLQLWLDGQRGRASGGWFFLLLPVCAVLTAFLSGRLVVPRLWRISASWDRGRCARTDLARLLLNAAFTIALAFAAARLLEGAGLDPRGSVVGTYVQRNALVVGFVMGFAIIPLIYTLAEDALSSVPGHLRQASLGAGASVWQTAMRVVVPTAMSGIFSAVMIGLGRAVGETMIVLMAAGNTPVMSWNVFSGFRTLSANIAVELPEAVRNDTHYRTLFLAALTLFAITFVLNTAAELVRQRFRRRAYQL